jgi:hypothetical protein
MTDLPRCCAVALALPLGALTAQHPPPLAPGMRVRITTADRPVHVIGTLQSIDSATIIVRRENGDTVNVLRRALARLDLRAGSGTCGGDRLGNCVVLGVLGSAVAGVLAGLPIAHRSDCGGEQGLPCGFIYLGTVPVGALVGAMGGYGGRRCALAPGRAPCSAEFRTGRLGRRAIGTGVAVLSGRRGCPELAHPPRPTSHRDKSAEDPFRPGKRTGPERARLPRSRPVRPAVHRDRRLHGCHGHPPETARPRSALIRTDTRRYHRPPPRDAACRQSRS